MVFNKKLSSTEVSDLLAYLKGIFPNITID